mmetsp:Transcript_86374/g.244835  ORF Transcript_86374/g.244835 Transcript_86374/m.244835 type:complete len:837 (-) Transcript_86374:118-2628(-)
MSSSQADVSTHAWFIFALGFYLCWMLSVSIMSRTKEAGSGRAGKSAAYQSYFLGGKAFGSIPLFLTLFSTVFSGYTVVGIPNEAAGIGFLATRWLTSYVMLLVSMVVYSPRLRRLSVARHYNSPNDIVTDRFDNRLLTSLMSLLVCAPQLIYIAANFYSLKGLLPMLSAYQLDSEVMVWIIAAVIFICESVGGFKSVSLTDAIQSSIMIASMLAVPFVALHYYGPGGDSVPLHCPNERLVNCTLPEYAGAVCSGRAISNGCLGSVDVAPWLTLHPAAGWSRFFESSWESGVRGIDGSRMYSNAPWNMLDFNILFFAFPLNPHWLQRVLAARTDAAIRNTLGILCFCSFFGAGSVIVLGIQVAANLKMLGTEGATAFGLFLTMLMDRGGFAELTGVLVSTSALAAIMSTADSAIMGISNVLTTDFLNKGLFARAPTLDTPTINFVAHRATSLVIILMSLLIALYDPQLNDKEEGSVIYGRLISWQNMLLWQALPTFTLALFMPRANAWALILGIVVGFTLILALFTVESNTELFGTPFATGADGDEANTKAFYLSPAVYAGFSNLIVSSVLSYLRVFPDDTPTSLRIGTREHGPTKLDGDAIHAIMRSTTEPVKDPVAIGCLLCAVALATLGLPWYGKPYSGCTLESYAAWSQTGEEVDGCHGPDLVGGLPTWVLTTIICWVLACLLVLVAVCRWKVIDKEATLGEMAAVFADRDAGGSGAGWMAEPSEPPGGEAASEHPQGFASEEDVIDLQSRINALEASISKKPSVDQEEVVSLQKRINELEASVFGKPDPALEPAGSRGGSAYLMPHPAAPAPASHGRRPRWKCGVCTPLWSR